MLSLLKKTDGEKSSERQVIPWRPDFRDVNSLPDIKTVRTHFFLNLVAVTIAGSLLLFFVYRELGVSAARASLEDLEGRIASAMPASEKARATYRLFLNEEARFNEANALVQDPFRFSKFALHLGQVLPPGVAVRRIDYRGGVVTVGGAVRGLDAAASDVASGVVKQLQNDPVLAEIFSAVTLVNLGRNAEEASLNLELSFTFKNAKGRAK